jgi:two-component system sensor histidine kinase HydH
MQAEIAKPKHETLTWRGGVAMMRDMDGTPNHSDDHAAQWALMVSGLAHEIKNPLSTISLNLNLLGEDIGQHSDPEHLRWVRRLDRVQKETSRIEQILSDFLQYAGHYELTLETVDLRDVVMELYDFFQPQADAARVVMRNQLPDQPVLLTVDVRLIKQTVLNLLLNAVQAMENPGELLMRLTSPDGQAVLEVIDTGPGMTAETLGKIFDPYWSSKKGGTGLGLPTARRIVGEHGGTLDVQSEPGQGTRFIMTLPQG